MGKIPVGWMPYSPIGNQVPGTRFIAFKVPLRETFVDKLKTEDRFTIGILLERVPELGLIIDLTQTTKYYNKNEVLDRGVDYVKIPTPGQVVPTQQYVDRFFEVVEYYLETHKNDDSLIGVHCTHGVNRTGYMLCRYLIQRLGYSVEDAVEAVGTARGHMIERSPYLASLRENQENIQKKKSGRGELEEGKLKMKKSANKPIKKMNEPRPSLSGKERYGRRDNPFSPPGREEYMNRPQMGNPMPYGDRGFTNPRGRSPPPPMRGRSPPLPMRGRSPPPSMRGRSPPPPMRGRSPPAPMRGRSPPPHIRGRSPPPPHHMRGRSPPPPEHFMGHTPPHHMRGPTPPPYGPPQHHMMRGRSPPPPHHMRGGTPPPELYGRPPMHRSRTPPYSRGRTPPSDMSPYMRGHSPGPMRGHTPPQVRGRSPPSHLRGRSPPSHLRGRSPPPHHLAPDVERMPPPRGRSPPPHPYRRTPPTMPREEVPRSPGSYPPRRDVGPMGRPRSPPRGREAPPAVGPPPSPGRRGELFPPGRRSPHPPSRREQPPPRRPSPPQARRDMPPAHARMPPEEYYRAEYGRGRAVAPGEGGREYSGYSRPPYSGEPGSDYHDDPYGPRRERSRSPVRREEPPPYYPEKRREPSPFREVKRRRKSPPVPIRERPPRSPPRYPNGREFGEGSRGEIYPDDGWDRHAPPPEDGPDCREILNVRRSMRDPYPEGSREYGEKKRSLVERLPPKNVDLRESLEEEKRRKMYGYDKPMGEPSMDYDRARYEEGQRFFPKQDTRYFAEQEGGIPPDQRRFDDGGFRRGRGGGRGGKRVFDRLARGRRGFKN